ncbi:MAG TPA: thrombospondin type 3 repeat-containing protein [Candidatus Thermoplasmatota archaeon]|nr:thrombospondin type 3 repeat-containing protein [Candidatus Thermoplasmatota archaeon]
MSRPISLLLAGSLFLAVLALPTHAGSELEPEVTDASGDIALLGRLPGCVPSTVPVPDASPVHCTGDVAEQAFAAGSGGDLVAAWIDGENATHFRLNILTRGDPAAFAQDPAGAGAMVASIRLTASMTINGTAKSAVVLFDADPPAPTVGGVAANVTQEGALTSITVLRASFGNIPAGTSLTGLNLTGESLGPAPPSQAPPQTPQDRQVLFSDAAGPGLPYNFTLSSRVAARAPTEGAAGCTYRSGEANRTDQDADCLPDHWEKRHFGGIAAQGAAGDPDSDGCNNRCEYLHGTDPTKADTDGDGTNDGDEAEAGTDPTDPSSHPGAVPPPTTTGSPTTTSTTTSRGTTTSRAPSSTTSTSAGAGPTSQSALDKIQADAGYVAASGAAMGAVVLVSLIGLFGRWGA